MMPLISGKKIKWITLLLFVSSFTAAQNGSPPPSDENDGVFWSGYKGSVKLNEKTNYVTLGQLWHNNEFGSFQSFLFEHGLERSLSSGVKVGLRYRYQRFPGMSQHRFFIDQFYSKKVSNNWVWKNRVRLHINTRSDRGPQYWIRLKSGVFYNLNNVKPFIQLELFMQPLEDDTNWDRIRVFAGTNWTLSKYMSVNTYYVLQRFWKNDPHLNEHIIGVDLIFRIP